MPLALALCCGQACILHAASVLSSGHSEQGGPCPRGHFCPRGTSLPRPCPAGFYNNLTGQASCFPCPAGYYCPETVTTYSGHPCPAGFYCPRGECPGCGPREQGWQWGRPWCSKLSRQTQSHTDWDGQCERLVRAALLWQRPGVCPGALPEGLGSDGLLAVLPEGPGPGRAPAGWLLLWTLLLRHQARHPVPLPSGLLQPRPTDPEPGWLPALPPWPLLRAGESDPGIWPVRRRCVSQSTPDAPTDPCASHLCLDLT